MGQNPPTQSGSLPWKMYFLYKSPLKVLKDIPMDSFAFFLIFSTSQSGRKAKYFGIIFSHMASFSLSGTLHGSSTAPFHLLYLIGMCFLTSAPMIVLYLLTAFLGLSGSPTSLSTRVKVQCDLGPSGSFDTPRLVLAFFLHGPSGCSVYATSWWEAPS